VILEKYHWPGNVRELENTIERAVILAEGRKITPEHLAIRIRRTDEIQLRDGAGLKEIGAHAQMQAERRPDGMESFYARSHVLHICHATGVRPVAGVYFVVKDVEGLMKDSEWHRSLGFVGRSCIHPSHVETINRVFGPKPEKVEWAKRVVAAIKNGREKGYGEVILDGVIVGPPTIIEVRRIFAAAGIETDI